MLQSTKYTHQFVALQLDFLARADGEIAALEIIASTLLGARESAQQKILLLQILHRLKGSSGSYGFHDLGLLARQIETALHEETSQAEVIELIGSLREQHSNTRPGTADRGKLESKMKTQSHVLCIEDDPCIALLIATCMTAIGVKVTTEPDGLEGFQRLNRTSPPDCLLVDLMLPGMTGLEIIRQVRADERFDAMPIVVLSANVNEDVRKDALALGVGNFLAKPFELEDLESLIKGVLSCNG